jgi:hypothetical protein
VQRDAELGQNQKRCLPHNGREQDVGVSDTWNLTSLFRMIERVS